MTIRRKERVIKKSMTVGLVTLLIVLPSFFSGQTDK